MPELGTSGSVGAAGGQLPAATRHRGIYPRWSPKTKIHGRNRREGVEGRIVYCFCGFNCSRSNFRKLVKQVLAPANKHDRSDPCPQTVVREQGT